MKKIASIAGSPPRAGGPVPYGTIGTMVNPALPIWPKLALNMSASKNGDGGRRQFTGQSNSRFEHGKIPANLPKISALHHLRIWKTGYEIPGLIPGTRFATRVPGYPGKSLLNT